MFLNVFPGSGAVEVRCLELTGDTATADDFDSFEASLDSKLEGHNLILTTPEKWDVVTRRKWAGGPVDRFTRLLQRVKLVMIDEVHLLNDSSRGHTLEAVVTRMKACLLNKVILITT